MNVFRIDPFYYPAVKYGGPIFCQYNLDRQMIKKGVNIDVLTTNGGLDEQRDHVLGEWTNFNGIRIKRFEYFGYEHFTFSPRILLSAINEAKKYDLIHISGIWNFTTIAGSIAGLLNKTPYIITSHGNLSEKAIGIKSKRKKLLYYKLISRFFIKNPAAIHFTTKGEHEEISKYPNIRIKSMIVPNGINLDEFRSLPNKGSFIQKYPQLKDKKYILFFGRITEIKGLDILVRAFHKISQSHRDIYLVIAGPDNEGYAGTIKKKLAQYGVADQAIFPGRLSGHERVAVLVDCELFVLPSYSENFGMSVVEDMACCIPVVFSEESGNCREGLKYEARV